MSTSAPRTPAGIALAVQVQRLVAAPLRIWRRSMRVRTLAITVMLSSIALIAVGTIVSYVIAQGLFADRRDQVLAESARAAAVAQASVGGGAGVDSATLHNAGNAA